LTEAGSLAKAYGVKTKTQRKHKRICQRTVCFNPKNCVPLKGKELD